MTEAYRQGFISKCASFGISNDAAEYMLKQASKLEHRLIASALKHGRKVSIEDAARITGNYYPEGYRTLNDFIAARERFFNKKVVPLLKKRKAIVKDSVPLSSVTPDGAPVFRGITRFSGRGGQHYINSVDIPEDILRQLPPEYPKWFERFIEKLEGRRFFSGVQDNAMTYANGSKGIGWINIADMSTPAGKWATKNGIVVSTPRIDVPWKRFRSAVRRMIDQGKLVPQRDLSTRGTRDPMHPLHTRLDSEMTIPIWLRPFLKERSYKLVNVIDNGKRTQRVVQKAQGRQIDRLDRKLNKLTYKVGPYKYNFDGFLASIPKKH